MNGPAPVCVVVPTYNRAGMLREALGSIMSQTVTPAEVVVVDDGSTDETPHVVREFEGGASAVTLLQLPHSNRRGPMRNVGIAAGTSPIVAFLDSDDLWKPTRLERQLEAWARAPEAGFAFCNCYRFDETGLLEPPCLPPAARWEGYILGDVLEEPVAGGSTLMVRREALDQVGGFRDLRMNEDYELTLRLAARYPASYVPEPLVLVREHAGRTTLARPETPLLDYLRIVRGFLEAHPELPGYARARARKGMANVHYKLASRYLELGKRGAAGRHLWAMARLKPLDRRALGAWLKVLASYTNRPASTSPTRRDEQPGSRPWTRG
ncbi:MAG: glycosyltransferase family 2 protein [Chloroflexota bacterium]|nr:glycosyltransferase family 2 protein [Chloroflexota bacterium]